MFILSDAFTIFMSGFLFSQNNTSCLCHLVVKHSYSWYTAYHCDTPIGYRPIVCYCTAPTQIPSISRLPVFFNTLRPRQDGCRFPDDTFERIFLNENIIILIKISLKFVSNGPINNIPALVQIMAWRRPGDKPLCESKLVKSLTHICVTRPQWVKS